MKKQIQRYAGVLLASAVVITGVASAANVDPIPSISNTFAISGQVIKSADINKLAEGLNILDTRTNNFKNNITVTDAGNVGIGTATPTSKLHLDHHEENFHALTLTAGADKSNLWQIVRRGANYGAGHNNDLLFWNSVNGTALGIKGDTGNVTIGTSDGMATEKLEVGGNVKATAFLYSSDERLKGNITPLENVLEKVSAMKGVSFDWKKDGKHDIGLIAQDVQKQFPEAVSQGADGYLAVDYSRMVPVLLEAIKEQQESIKEQQKEIDELQCKLGDCK